MVALGSDAPLVMVTGLQEQQARYRSPLAEWVLQIMQQVISGQRSRTTKPGAIAPGLCLLSRGAVPRGAGAAVRGFVLGNSRDRFQIRWFSVVGGAAGAGTWGQVSSGTFRSVRGT